MNLTSTIFGDNSSTVNSSNSTLATTISSLVNTSSTWMTANSTWMTANSTGIYDNSTWNSATSTWTNANSTWMIASSTRINDNSTWTNTSSTWTNAGSIWASTSSSWLPTTTETNSPIANWSHETSSSHDGTTPSDYLQMEGNTSTSLGYAFPESGYIILFLILTISGLLGIVGNSFIITLSRTDKSLSHPFGFLLELLCWCGLLMSVLGSPFTAASNYAHYWLFGDLGCDVYSVIMATVGIMQEDTLVMIALYRYITLCKPFLKYRLTKRFLQKVTLVFFVEAVFWAVAPLLGWGSYAVEGVGTSCGPDWLNQDTVKRSYTLALAITHLAIPMPLLMFCYFSIVFQLYRLRKVRNAPYLDMERKIFPLIVAITVGFILAYVPYGIILVATMMFGEGALHPLVTTIPGILMKMSCFWNSLIYITTDAAYRKAANRVFKNKIFVSTQ